MAGIGWRWAVYHRQSNYDTDGIIATSVAQSPQVAQGVVEKILDGVPDAAWGLLLRVFDDALVPGEDAPWPPAGVTMKCTRTGDGSLRWAPLYRNTIVFAAQEMQD
jgi:hypothetical protein